MEKFRKSIKYPLMTLIVVLAFYSCKKTGVAPSASNGSKIAFGLQSFSAAGKLPASAGSQQVNAVTGVPQITWTAGIANITKFKFEAKRGGIEREFVSRNLMNVDLFALNPSLITTPIDSGTYREIEVKVILSQTADTTALPLKLTGSFTSTGGTVVPVELDLNSNVEIKAEAKDVVVSSTQNLQTIFLLNLNQISSGISASDLAAATLTGGKVVISSTSNTNLYNIILQNVSKIGDTKMEVEDAGDDHGGHGGDDNSGHDGNDNSGHN